MYSSELLEQIRAVALPRGAKVVLKTVAKLVGNYLCRIMLGPATLFKKRFQHRCFPLNLMKIL